MIYKSEDKAIVKPDILFIVVPWKLAALWYCAPSNIEIVFPCRIEIGFVCLCRKQCDGIIAEMLSLIQSFLLLSFQCSVCFIVQHFYLKPHLVVYYLLLFCKKKVVYSQISWYFAYLPVIYLSLYQGPRPSSEFWQGGLLDESCQWAWLPVCALLLMTYVCKNCFKNQYRCMFLY